MRSRPRATLPNSDGVQCKTLDRLISRKVLCTADVLRYGIAVVDGLAKAHSAGTVHRDLKPSNIIVSDDV